MPCLWPGPSGFIQCWSCCCVLILFLLSIASWFMSRIVTKRTNRHVRPAKTQISLGIRPVWSESSLSAWRKLGSLATHWAHSEDSDQTGHMPFCWFCQDPALVCLLFGHIDESLHADRITWLYVYQPQHNLSTPVMYYWPFQGGASVVVYSYCQCSFTFCLSLTLCSFYLG